MDYNSKDILLNLQAAPFSESKTRSGFYCSRVVVVFPKFKVFRSSRVSTFVLRGAADPRENVMQSRNAPWMGVSRTLIHATLILG